MGPRANWFSIFHRSISSSLQPETQNFLDATLISDPIIIAAIDARFIFLKDNDLLQYVDAEYPMVGGTAGTCKFNLVNPADSNAAHRLGFSGGWTFTADDAQPNGINGFADMNINASTDLDASQFGVSVVIGNNASGGYDLGCDNNAGAVGNPVFLITRYTGNVAYFGYGNNSYGISKTAVADSSGITHGFYEGGTAYLYKGTSFWDSQTESAGPMPNRNLYLGAMNLDGTAGLFSNKKFRYVCVHRVPLAQIALWNMGIENFMTSLGK